MSLPGDIPEDESAGESQWSYFRDMDGLGLRKSVIKSLPRNWGSYILNAVFLLRETSKVGCGRRIKALYKCSSGKSSAKPLGATLIPGVSLIVSSSSLSLHHQRHPQNNKFATTTTFNSMSTTISNDISLVVYFPK
jgi:hypothetical protein